eukprot:Sspe_Gene.27673::Locus_12038_Transcript_1_1_Confidence_1.000_Length_2140::g.27673::m.27673
MRDSAHTPDAAAQRSGQRDSAAEPRGGGCGGQQRGGAELRRPQRRDHRAAVERTRRAVYGVLCRGDRQGLLRTRRGRPPHLGDVEGYDGLGEAFRAHGSRAAHFRGHFRPHPQHRRAAGGAHGGPQQRRAAGGAEPVHHVKGVHRGQLNRPCHAAARDGELLLGPCRPGGDGGYRTQPGPDCAAGGTRPIPAQQTPPRLEHHSPLVVGLPLRGSQGRPPVRCPPLPPREGHRGGVEGMDTAVLSLILPLLRHCSRGESGRPIDLQGDGDGGAVLLRLRCPASSHQSEPARCNHGLGALRGAAAHRAHQLTGDPRFHVRLLSRIFHSRALPIMYPCVLDNVCSAIVRYVHAPWHHQPL